MYGLFAQTLWLGPSLLLKAVTAVILYLSQTLLTASLLVLLLYSTGWMDRIMCHLAEWNASLLLNWAPVTIGSMQVDLIRGKVWVSNVIVHAPQRKAWKWESPVLCRIGKAHVSTNLAHCLLFKFFLREELPLELYTVELSDIQVFVERKQQVFNFYLMDKSVTVPDPVTDEQQDDEAEIETEDVAPEPLFEPEQGDNDEAQQLVDDMVRTIGRAAHEGWQESGKRLASQLKQLMTQENVNKTAAMQKGVKIVQKVSQNLVAKTQNLPQVITPNRTHNEGAEIVYGRVGRIVLNDVRVFTRDHQYSNDTSKLSSKWNKPICMEQVVVRAAELCAPLSATDKDQLPIVHQPVDKIIEVVVKRVLAEMSKSSRFLQSAVGEVLEYMEERN
jgi:hypothetical protein